MLFICSNTVFGLCSKKVSIFHIGDMEEQYILVVSWCCQLNSPGFHFFSQKKSEIWMAFTFWEVKVKLKLLEIENKKWKWKQNFREISRNENLAGYCDASSISDCIFLLSCMKKSFPDYSKAALLHWKALITCIPAGKRRTKFDSRSCIEQDRGGVKKLLKFRTQS